MMKIILILAMALSCTHFSQAQTTEIKAPTVVSGEGGDAAAPEPLIADVPASFPGGRGAMHKFLSENLVYPAAALEKELEGKCYVRFVVDTDGTVLEPKIVKGVTDCPACDREALRVVRLMPQWIPAQKDKKPVKSYFNLPITYRLQ
jgi:TonB family protein